MRRQAVYSRSSKARGASAARGDKSGLQFGPPTIPARSTYQPSAPPPKPTLRALGALIARHRGKATVAASVAATLVVLLLVQFLVAPLRNLTQADISEAVDFAISERGRPPSTASLAYATIIPSVVRVSGYDPRAQAEEGEEPATADGEQQVPVDVPEEGDQNFHERFTAVGTGW